MLPILAYHSLDDSGSVISVTPATFARQMTILAEVGFRGLALREAVALRKQHGVWPARAAAITFDDGYKNLLEHALPVLARHGFSATIFLVSQFVGRHNDWESPPAGFGRRATLDWTEVRKLANAGIEIGAHTRTHPDLRSVDDETLERELAGSQGELQEGLGAPVRSLAYPYGGAGEREFRAAARLFDAAVTTVLSRAGDEPPERLPRLDVYYLSDEARFRRAIAGKLDYYLALRRWGRALKRRFGQDRKEAIASVE